MGPSPDTSDIYRPPGVEVERVQQGPSPPFYVVSPAKCVTLFVCTVGIYQFFWFYLHFRSNKLALKDDTWPLARAVFALFFTHSLFRRISAQGGQFNADTYATMYVVLLIVGRIIGRITQDAEVFGALDLLGLVLGMTSLIPLLAAQKAANQACNDPAGEQNSRLTLGNWAWCGLGTLGWLLILAGMLMPK